MIYIITPIILTISVFIAYSIGFSSGCGHMLDIYSGNRWVKWSKNPYQGIKKGYIDYDNSSNTN